MAVVIPAYRARKQILSVLGRIGPEVDRIFVVDDCCPEGTGDHVQATCLDPRVQVLRNAVNLGVGGATMAGYQAAASAGSTVVVKIDADGQMDPSLVRFFVEPILAGWADYTKGNRFFNAASLASMPRARLFGNAVLSLLTKLSTGYWTNMDPTNGYTAIHCSIVNFLPIDRISKRFFFETDLLFYLGLLRAVVVDIPIVAQYGEEESNLEVKSIVLPFMLGHAGRFVRRIALNYFIRDFSFASLCLMIGAPLFLFGTVFGLVNWIGHMISWSPTPTGTIMLATLSVLLGIQLILFFFSADIAATPRQPLHSLLDRRTMRPLEQFASVPSKRPSDDAA